MKFFKTLLVLILISSTSFGQIKKNEGITKDSNKNKAISDSNLISKSKKSNSKETLIPIEPNRDTKIILVKEKGETDYPKYLLPIFTLLLGIAINKILDRLADRKKTKRTGERWIVELRSTEEPIKEQITSLKEFKEGLENQNFEHPRLSIFTAINGELFKSLDKNDLIKYIELKNKKPWYKKPYATNKKAKLEEYKKIIKISNRTHGHISILVHQFEMIKEKFQSYLSGTSNHTTSFSKNLQIFIKSLQTYNLEIEKEGANMNTDARVKPIFDLYMIHIHAHRNDGKYNPFTLETNFFIPVLGILTPFRMDERTIPLTSSITACLNDIAGIKMEKIYMIENTTTLIKRYEELLEDLNPIINEIDGT